MAGMVAGAAVVAIVGGSGVGGVEERVRCGWTSVAVVVVAVAVVVAVVERRKA
jgi:hypothetical protein